MRKHSTLYLSLLTPQGATCSSSPWPRASSTCPSWTSIQLNSQHQSQINKLCLRWVDYAKSEGLHTALFRASHCLLTELPATCFQTSYGSPSLIVPGQVNSRLFIILTFYVCSLMQSLVSTLLESGSPGLLLLRKKLKSTTMGYNAVSHLWLLLSWPYQRLLKTTTLYSVVNIQ